MQHALNMLRVLAEKTTLLAPLHIFLKQKGYLMQHALNMLRVLAEKTTLLAPLHILLVDIS